MEFTPELLEKAKQAESAEALKALAKENEYDMSDEEASAYFAQLHKSGELNDEELENVSGGGCHNGGHLVVSPMHSCDLWKCKKHNREPEYSGHRNYYTGADVYRCPVCHAVIKCKDCIYCHYEKALWLCYNPEK